MIRIHKKQYHKDNITILLNRLFEKYNDNNQYSQEEIDEDFMLLEELDNELSSQVTQEEVKNEKLGSSIKAKIKNSDSEFNQILQKINSDKSIDDNKKKAIVNLQSLLKQSIETNAETFLAHMTRDIDSLVDNKIKNISNKENNPENTGDTKNVIKNVLNKNLKLYNSTNNEINNIIQKGDINTTQNLLFQKIKKNDIKAFDIGDEIKQNTSECMEDIINKSLLLGNISISNEIIDENIISFVSSIWSNDIKPLLSNARVKYALLSVGKEIGGAILDYYAINFTNKKDCCVGISLKGLETTFGVLGLDPTVVQLIGTALNVYQYIMIAYAIYMIIKMIWRLWKKYKNYKSSTNVQTA